MKKESKNKWMAVRGTEPTVLSP